MAVLKGERSVFCAVRIDTPPRKLGLTGPRFCKSIQCEPDGRAVRLRKRLGVHFLLVHLVRDPRAVCWSSVRTAEKHQDTRLMSAPIVRCLRSSVGWIAANLACELFGRFHPQQYMRLYYECVCRSPQDVLRTILKKVSAEPLAILDPTRNFDNRHQLYGNSMRFKRLALDDVREDTIWRSQMPRGLSRLAAALCWPLGAKYGYLGAKARPRTDTPSSMRPT